MDRMVNEKSANNQITPEEAYECRETSMLLHELIDELPEEQRQCILLYYMEEYSIKDIAGVCKCSENTIKSRLNYGKKKLEEKTIELQKKGYVLRGVTPVYLITWLLKTDMGYKLKFVYDGAATSAFSHTLFTKLVNAGLVTAVNSGLTNAVGSGMNNTVQSGMTNMVNSGMTTAAGETISGGTATVAEGTAAVNGGTAVAGTAAKGVASTAVKGGIHTLAGKIITGALATVIAGGLVTAGVVTVINNNKTEDEITTEATTEEITTELTTTETTTDTTTEEEVTENTSSEAVASDLEDKNIFENLPSKFTFSSGVGAWATELYIESDGSFTGKYYDYNYDEASICNFYGNFTTPEKVNDYTYSMHLESLNYEGTEGTVYYDDGVKYTIVESAYGLDYADEIYIYLPGTPISELSEDSIDTDANDTLSANLYLLYNINGDETFYGLSDDYIWDNTYIYTYGNYTSKLFTYVSSAFIDFFSEDGHSAPISILLKWEYDDQTEFDYGNYHISLDISDDYSKITATIISSDKTDFSAWGGTTDGEIVMEFILDE